MALSHAIVYVGQMGAGQFHPIIKWCFVHRKSNWLYGLRVREEENG